MLVSPFLWPMIHLLPLDLSGKLSDYELLEEICNKLNQIIEAGNNDHKQLMINTQAIAGLQTDVNNIQSELEKVKNGEYVSLYLDSIINYINNNLADIVGSIAKFVVFGLSQDGHFMITYPSSWSFIHWDTIMDYSSPLYGHLVMRW